MVGRRLSGSINRQLAGALFALAALLPAAGRALDQPVSGATLRLTRSAAGKEKLLFVSKDPASPFPPVGTADDPAQGTPGGFQFEVIAGSAVGAFTAPPGLGRPGWSIKYTAPSIYRFANAAAPGGITPIRTATVAQGKSIKVVLRNLGIPLTGGTGPIAIRGQMGSLRFCTRFGPATITTDLPGKYRAANAPAPALADCSDASLGVGP